MSRLEKTDDIIELAIMLQNSYCGLTIEEIAEKFGCSRRSAERMRALLEEKFPDKLELVEQTADKKKHWRFKKGTINFLINFTSSDFANLEHCKELINNSAKKKEISELIEKIKALNLKNTYQNDIDEIIKSRGYAVHQRYRENINPDYINMINEAVLSQKQMKFVYNIAENIVNPYGIIYSDKQYLVAFNTYKNDIRIYRISKIHNAELLESYFEKDEDFDISEYANSSFGIYQGEKLDVELLFSKSAKPDILEYYFHPTQNVQELENGDVRVTFRASGSFEIITELLKWRDTVKIIAPQALKEEYESNVRDIFKNISAK